jgi:hypothetical protein
MVLSVYRSNAPRELVDVAEAYLNMCESLGVAHQEHLLAASEKA